MIEIVEGSLVESKEQMKKTISIIKLELSKFKKNVKKKDRTKEQERIIHAREVWLNFFKVSQMAPVFIDNICINYKLYERFLKKLKGYQITESIEVDAVGHPQRLIISYEKGSSKGQLALYDISPYLEGLSFFPRAVIKE